MQEFENLHAEWQSWLDDWWPLYGSVDKQLEKAGALKEMEAYIAKHQWELDNDADDFLQSAGDEEDGEDGLYVPGFFTEAETAMWTHVAPQYPHPYLMETFMLKAMGLELEHTIAAIPGKVIVALGVLVNWQPFDEEIKLELTPLLGGWKINEIISLWLDAHPESNVRNIPDLDGKPQWYWKKGDVRDGACGQEIRQADGDCQSS